MKKIIIYGAGNIGRGFIGQLLHESGYELVFVDIDKKVIKKLNDDRRYPIKIVSHDLIKEIMIDNLRAVDGMDVEAVSNEISSADIMSTSVGVNIIPRIIKPILEGLRKRWAIGNLNPLNIIICENLLDSAKIIRGLFHKELTDPEIEIFNKSVGIVEASIGRMVPVMTKKMQEGNILRVWVEEYSIFPVDKDGFIGELPKIKNLVPYSPFNYYIQRKLFIHNLGHAIAAYLGYLSGYEYVWQSVEDRVIRQVTINAMNESAKALSLEHNVDLEDIIEHVNDLIYRFGNKHLGDTVKRVGGDPLRKLSPNDRLVGTANLCLKHGIVPSFICFGIWAALQFDPEGDVTAEKLKKMIEENGKEYVLREICNIESDSSLVKMIINTI